MTNEEAIKIFNTLMVFGKVTATKDELQDLCKIAIKALEQECILDKIRAEIEQKCCITVGKEYEPAITLYDIFQIIDKYKAESKEEA